jgi:23S rRNA (uracil1939-C5)-methyltransferase
VRKKKNIILEKIKVEDYAAEGKSLAKLAGKVIFIGNAVPGDIVDVRLSKNKKDWAEGTAIHFHEYSRERVEPFCPHFGVCGGCQWQMLPYEKQMQYKQKQVEETLKRIGKVELPRMLPIIGAEETKFYRNKLEYTFSNREFLPPEEFKKFKNESTTGSVVEVASSLEEGRNMSGASVVRPREESVAGFHARGIFDKVIDIKTCFLQDEPTNALRLAIKGFAKKNGYSFYDIKHHQGFMRTLQLRICTTGEVMANIVFGYEDKEKREYLLDFILKGFPGITTLVYTINTKWNDSLNDLDSITYSGKGYVIEKMEDFQFKIGPGSFFQTNTKQGERLYNVTREFAELSGDEIIYDLYCGTGSIGIFLSKKARKIIGIEIIEAAAMDARENAALNNLSQAADFYTGDVTDICNAEFFSRHGKPDVIITDPPRAGMHEKLVKKILDIAAPVVVYVSCNPATQARDLNLLDEKYAVTKIQPVDMFPHTHHIENVVQLKLKQSGELHR